MFGMRADGREAPASMELVRLAVPPSLHLGLDGRLLDDSGKVCLECGHDVSQHRTALNKP